MASKVHFFVNHDPFDGSAHAVYCFRTVWWLAKSGVTGGVHFYYPSGSRRGYAGETFGLPPVEGLFTHALPALRKDRGRGITLNFVYFHALRRVLEFKLNDGDVVASASFDKLFAWLVPRLRKSRRDFRAGYEVHQWSQFEEQPNPRQATLELAALQRAERVITTTEALENSIRTAFPDLPIANLGLPCGFDPSAFPPCVIPASPEPVRVGYTGSVYEEQGVEWLIENWDEIRRFTGRDLRLEIAGGHPDQVTGLRRLAGKVSDVTLHGPVRGEALPGWVAGCHLFVIPALDRGRMGRVAITKSYDYLAFSRPLLVSNLPSITRVIRDGAEGLVFEPGNVAALSTALRRVLEEPGLAGRLAAAAVERAGTFAPERRARDWFRFMTER